MDAATAAEVGCKFERRGELLVCAVCGSRMKTPSDPSLYFMRCGGPRPAKDGAACAVKTKPGPGTVLRTMLKDLGIVMRSNCKCATHASEMDDKGPDWCAENEATIVGWLKDAMTEAGWMSLLRAVAAVAITGWTWLSVTDPLGSLVRESIRRSRE